MNETVNWNIEWNITLSWCVKATRNSVGGKISVHSLCGIILWRAIAKCFSLSSVCEHALIISASAPAFLQKYEVLSNAEGL